MIVPFLAGIRDFIEAPITWTLVLLNLFFFFITMDAERIATPQNGAGIMLETKSLQRTGVFYRQYLAEASSKDNVDYKNLPSSTELILWGGKALRDPSFLKAIAAFDLKGDPEEIKAWKTELAKFQEGTAKRQSTRFGIAREASAAVKKPLTWVTYQFMHAGALHLISNMIFLLIFGIALERNAGSFMVLLGFLGGGIFGAAFALLTDEASAIPMVGASASIAALMALYLVSEQKKNIRFFFFLSPFQGGYGDIYLSKWWILPLCFIPDIVNFSMDQWMPGQELFQQSVATSAHIGGSLYGALLGFILAARSLSAPYSRSRPEAP